MVYMACNYTKTFKRLQELIHMDFTTLGSTQVPVLGIGTWGMGGSFETDTTEDEKYVQALKTAIKMGMTHIDTAEMYGKGHAEELVGKAIQEFNREELFITTKVKGQNLRYDDVIAAAAGSLKRLNTNYIDLYLIHWPNPSIPLSETMKALDYLVAQGTVQNIGVSNFSVEGIHEAQKHAKNRVVANQIEYNLRMRNRGQFTNDMETRIIPYCKQHNITVIVYRPIQPLVRGELSATAVETVNSLARKYGKTPVQVALNWLLSKNLITIPKASSPAHLTEVMGSLGWKLTQEDIDVLDKLV